MVLAPAAAIVIACSSNDSNTNYTGDGGYPTCATSKDCATGTVCAYDDGTGCNTIGECVTPQASAPVFSACGCQGQPVAYVASGYTASPVASSGPCVDAAAPSDDAGPGKDSGSDGAATSDGGTEASTASEAGSEGGSDSGPEDASDGAPE
jgi:hypothetical protein